MLKNSTDYIQVEGKNREQDQVYTFSSTSGLKAVYITLDATKITFKEIADFIKSRKSTVVNDDGKTKALFVSRDERSYIKLTSEKNNDGDDVYSIQFTPQSAGVYLLPCLKWGYNVDNVKNYVANIGNFGVPQEKAYSSDVKTITYGTCNNPSKPTREISTVYYVHKTNGLQKVEVTVDPDKASYDVVIGFLKYLHNYVSGSGDIQKFVTDDKKSDVTFENKGKIFLITYQKRV